jgi:hypothetical protein
MSASPLTPVRPIANTIQLGEGMRATPFGSCPFQPGPVIAYAPALVPVARDPNADGCDALSDEDAAEGGDRDGAARPRLQPHARDEHRRYQAIAGSHAGVRRAPTAAPRCTEVQEG